MSDNTANQPPAPGGNGGDNPTDRPTEPRGRSAGRSRSHKVGDVIKTGEQAYGLVVGFEDVTHHGEHNDGSAKVEKKSHPLVVDLPAPRRIETETEAAS